MIWLYRFLTQLFRPFIALHIKARLRKGKEPLDRLSERWGIASKQRPQGLLIWTHAASIGEALSSLALITKLQEKCSQTSFLLTTGTVSSAQVMHKYTSETFFHQFLPLDIPDVVDGFLNHWKPDLVLWVESDLWPNILHELAKRRIKTYLVNARLSDSSYKAWLWFKLIFKSIIACFSAVYAQSPQQARRFKSLGAKTVHALGNLKFSSPPLGCDAGQLKTLQGCLSGKVVWLAASTHAGEEEAVVKTHLLLQQKFPHVITLIAPRHLHRTGEIVKIALANHLVVQKRTENAFPAQDTDIFICDTLGEMGLFFQAVPIVFLGGSLVPIGGHNIIEPASFGCAIVHGPYGQNFQDTMDIFTKAGGMVIVHSAHQMAAQIKKWMENPDQRKTDGKKALSIVQKNQKLLDNFIMDMAKKVKQHDPFS